VPLKKILVIKTKDLMKDMDFMMLTAKVAKIRQIIIWLNWID
jgi:hypothetical protein